MSKINIKVGGMSCGHCVKAVEKELTKSGVSGFSVEIGSVILATDDKTSIEKTKNAILEAGYSVLE